MIDASIVQLLERTAAEHRERAAILAQGEAPLTYSGLLDLVSATGDRLAAETALAAETHLAPPPGAERRIAIVMPNGPEMATLCLAVAATATAVPLNPEYTCLELCVLMKRLRVSLLVATRSEHAARQAAAELGLPVLTVSESASGVAGDFTLDSERTYTGAATAGASAAARSANDLALVLHTSGSTAQPKIVPLSQQNVLTSAYNVARSLELGSTDVCLSTMPLFHIGALVDLLLAPLSAGGTVVVARSMTATDYFAHLEEFSPTWAQGVPTMLQDVLRKARAEDRSGSEGLRFVRSVSAPLPVDVLEAFEERFELPVIEIYGMTETSGVITSNPMPPAKRRAGSVGVSAGPEVVIVDAAGNAAGVSRRGEVLVRGPSVLAGYEDLSAGEGFTNGWLRTGDEGYLDPDGYLYLTGRIKELINRGGEKVSPREVDEVALTCSGVADAAAFAMPHDSLGEEVGLAVVAEAGRNPTAEDIVEYCTSRLAAFKVPRTVFFLNELPRAAGGKLQRRKILETCRDTITPQPQPGAAREPSARERDLIGMWETALGVSGFGLEDDFFDLGGDSLGAAEFVEAIRQRFGVTVPAAALFDHPTVAAFSAHMEGSLTSRTAPLRRAGLDPVTEVRGFLAAWHGARATDDSLLVGWNTLGSRPPLFWGVQSFGELSAFAEGLGEDQPVYGMRSLFEAKTKSAENTVLLAGHYAKEIQKAQPKGPVHLGGYCAGGGLAVHIARGLRAAGREVASLSLFEHFTAEPWTGPAAFFFNVDSGWHPFKQKGMSWRTDYSGEVHLYPSHASHEEILTDGEMLAALRIEMEHREAAATEAERAGTSDSMPPIRCEVVSQPRAMWSRETRTVWVDVTNDGTHALSEGTALFDRWSRNSQQVLLDAVGSMETPLQPGDSVRIALDVSAPLTPGVWRVDFDVVHNGNWNDGGPHTEAHRTVLVLPGAAVWSYLFRRVRGIWT